LTIVIDASVAVKWVCAEPDSDQAVALQTETLIAPTLWLAEAGNALWRRVRIGDIQGDEALARLARLHRAPVASLPMEPLLDRALALAVELNHPIYDCLYLALAVHHDTHAVTADRRFAAAAQRRPALLGRVRLLGK
jgi:predicted nucleic acid-binding protein